MRRAALALCLLAALVTAPEAARAQRDEPGVTGTDRAAALDATRANAPRVIPVALAGPVDPALYRVGPGDQFVIQLRGPVTRTMPMEVDPEGMLLIPEVGPVHVSGSTLALARKDVVSRVRGQFRNVEVDLQLVRPRSFRVALVGQVREPGTVTVNATMRVGDLIEPGMLLEGASRRRIALRHLDGTREECDLARLWQAGDAVRNPLLRDGDVVEVPSATEFVVAQGAVARPGRYELSPSDHASTLLRLAGDPLPSALVDELLILRFDGTAEIETLHVNVEDVYSGRNDPSLGDGDHLYLYFLPRYRLQHEAHIVGEVQRPGAYPITEGATRLSQLVRSASGFLPGADLTSIHVRRRTAPGAEKDAELDRLLRLSRSELTASEYEVLRTRLASQREEYRVHWSSVLRDTSRDLLLRDGDVVQIDRLVLSIRVDGEVRRPGIVNFVPGTSVEDYVRTAGGYTSRAWHGKVRVTRAVTGQTLLARNVRSLDPGDFVWVPEKPDVTVWEQAGRVLSSLAQIATVVIAIRSVR
ncbi:MAG: SLBB domain-containing protein [Candidatus Eisenbacteria bacterium]|uniref:SLBB domain-containing protein n=1 Tax=Eiseniibacteriota bacterium TaxID=2212470 RepID=A0A933W1M2_UNCEI|nr:SLBB domain-containing protein [Candidatus Eisenbacteria bacterium]